MQLLTALHLNEKYRMNLDDCLREVYNLNLIQLMNLSHYLSYFVMHFYYFLIWIFSVLVSFFSLFCVPFLCINSKRKIENQLKYYYFPFIFLCQRLTSDEIYKIQYGLKAIFECTHTRIHTRTHTCTRAPRCQMLLTLRFDNILFISEFDKNEFISYVSAIFDQNSNYIFIYEIHLCKTLENSHIKRNASNNLIFFKIPYFFKFIGLRA